MAGTLHFRIQLLGSPVPIWRRFQLRDDYRMDRFHQVIQIVMGWTNSHLHEFQLQNRNIGMTGDFTMDSPEVEEESKIFLKDFSLRPKDSFIYLYDFGDYWEHQLVVEKITDQPIVIPICTDGVNGCPPEDCGSIHGYKELLQIINNPSHPEYDEFINWLPENFQPYYFPKDQVNGELLLFGQWHNKYPRKKSTPWHQI